MNRQKLQNKSFKFMVAFLISATVMMIYIEPTLAKDKVKIKDSEYGGNGCPQGSASVSISPDGQELSILFDKFVALGNQATESRKSCTFSIPIQVPQGFQISIYDVDYRGYVAPKTIGRLRVEYFFAGQRGSVFSRTFRGETDYNVRDKLVSMRGAWSACGNNVNMQLNAAMVASGQGIATVDSFDLASRGLVYYIKYRQCKK
ncbi:DUF4360 domain-containing protein [Anabaena sp. UHCC 0399]|uniref:DUF4360 domain-containing protein n=1 Tax=Anabaena sp. UHCC 0399 TaxID=3110238 RepID=UPI002B218D2A|nr:DUF4360 domain-containing protein [Anabaena sp. UHCC 0399]MEA5567814.1 DUF4360 domain-containing protein [Anabaena sp. UHCC 0399]